MIRRLIILLLIVGCVFGDTIVYKSGSKNRTIENVEYIKAGNGKVYFKAHGGEVSRDCSKVVTFTNNVGNPIDYDCSVSIDKELEEPALTESSIPSTESEHSLSTLQKDRVRIGGFFIAIGSLILMITVDSECDDCETITEINNYYDRISDTRKLGFGLIAFGGILNAFRI